MIDALFRAFARSPLALREEDWCERILRHAVMVLARLENTIVFHVGRLRMAVNGASKGVVQESQRASDTTLLSVYSLKSNGLTFDLITFLGIVEMERLRRGLQRNKVIIYAPPEFPLYQWQRLKVFNNCDGRPLIRAERGHVLDYVRKLSDAARIFSATMQCEVVGERRDLFATMSAYPHVFPRSSGWTGDFENMTAYKNYSKLKYDVTGGQDAITGSRRRLGTLWSHRIGGGKLVATVNFRNQKYSTDRNVKLEHWESFLSHPFIKKHFHFIVFDDAENPVTVRATGCATFCDRYIHDNFRRFKTILGVGLHIGSVSGSASIVIISDVPYLFLGAENWEDWNPLNPERYAKEGDLLFYDRDRRYQLVSFRQGGIMDDVRLFLTSISESPQVLERYPDGFRKKLTEILQDWP